MHDHQSDWKSIYSDLDDVDNMDNLNDPLMDGDSNHSLINSQQLNHAKSIFHHIKLRAIKALGQIDGLKSSNKHFTQIKINDLFTQAQINLQNVNYQVQIKNLIHKVKIQTYRIVIIERFTNFIQLINSELQQASLTKLQLNSAISEVKAINKYTQQDLNESHTISSLRSSYISGKNSINGSLVKYIADSQINISNQLKRISDQIHHNIGIQPNLNVAAKYLAYQRIDSIRTDITADLMGTNKFSELKQVRSRGLEQLKSILNDKNKVLKDLTLFNKFVSKIRSMVSGLLEFSSNEKLNLEQQIDNYQKDVETTVQQFNHVSSNNEFNYREHHLSVMVFNMIIENYQKKISDQKIKLSSVQQESALNKIDLISTETHNNFEQSYLKDSIEASLIKGLRQLKVLMEQLNLKIYQNQINQFVSNINAKISQLYELSAKNRHHLRNRINFLSQHLLNNYDNMSISLAKKKLYGSFHKQARYMINSAMHQVFSSLYEQIKESHLSSNHTKYFLDCLNKIRQKSDINYTDRQLLIKNVLHRSLIVDKNENLQLMTKLNENLRHRIDYLDIAAQLDYVLKHDLIKFSQRINNASQIITADHEEQQFENDIYLKLYHLYEGTDLPQAQALQVVILTSKKAHHHVNIAVLNSRINERINIDISKCTNTYLYQLLSIHDDSQLKRYTSKVIDNIHQQIIDATHYLKKVYVSQIDQLFKGIDYQLKGYSVSWHVLSEAGVIQSQTITRIKQANSLLQIEYSKQIGHKQINSVISKIVNHADNKKRRVNKRIDDIISLINDRLKRIQQNTKHIDLAFLNRILKAINLAKYRINKCLDSGLANNYHYYAHLLERILRKCYLREWLLIVSHAHNIIKNLNNIPIQAKIKTLQSIQSLKLNVTLKLQKCNQSDLIKVLQTNNNGINKLINHGIYLDPVKKKAYHNLVTLVNQIKTLIQDSFDKKSSKKLLISLNNLSHNVNDKFVIGNDKKVKSIYHTKLKELTSFKLKLDRKIQLNNFVKFTHKYNKHLEKLTMLANREVQESNRKFNYCYHKVIYQISHASNAIVCHRDEQQGEKAVQKILIKYRAVNNSKQRFYTAVNLKIKQAKRQIISLKSIQKGDKKDSNKLLNQIKRQTYQNIKQSLSRNQMINAKAECHRMIKQVIDKVSSASVLVAAIKSANSQISQSTLDKKQKDATLKQINQIIDQGIQKQFNQNDSSSKPKSSANFNYLNQKINRSNNLNNAKSPSKDENKSHSSFMSYLIKVMKNFFRWIGGMLARAF